jgi:hypothetical protein
LITFRKLETGSTERVSGNIPLQTRPLKTEKKPAEALGTFPCKPKMFRNRFRKAIINGVLRKE